MAETVFVGEMTFKDYNARVSDGQTVLMLPVGALEQHGHHMAMNVDVLLPTAVCERVARAQEILRTPQRVLRRLERLV